MRSGVGGARAPSRGLYGYRARPALPKRHSMDPRDCFKRALHCSSQTPLEIGGPVVSARGAFGWLLTTVASSGRSMTRAILDYPWNALSRAHLPPENRVLDLSLVGCLSSCGSGNSLNDTRYGHVGLTLRWVAADVPRGRCLYGGEALESSCNAATQGTGGARRFHPELPGYFADRGGHTVWSPGLLTPSTRAKLSG